MLSAEAYDMGSLLRDLILVELSLLLAVLVKVWVQAAIKALENFLAIL